MCRLRRWFGKLDLLQALGDFASIERLLALEQRLEPRAEGLAAAEVDPGFERLEHSLNRPLLPLLEGDPGDFELAADLAGFGALRPH